jgi:pimeloyl-ACP methyl ester carboxylesterase
MKLLVAALGAIAGSLLLGALATWLITRSIEARYPPEGRFVALDGGRLHYVEAGPADGTERGTIVFLHGASGSHADPMLALGDRLSERYRVIALDRPGHGWSERIDGPAAALPARQAEIVRQALARLNVDRAVVVAHSWAGAVLPNLSLIDPELVAGALYLAPVTHPWPGGGIAWYHAPAARSWLGWLMTRTITTPTGALVLDAATRAVFAPQEPPAHYVERARVPLTLRPSAFRANSQDVAGLYAAVSAQQVRYPEIRVPTVIISGDADPIVWTDVHSRGLAWAVPGTRLIILPGVGHMPHHAAPDLVIAEIEVLAGRLVAAK